MAPTAGSPVTWTLRLKRGKSTTLLHVDPLQSFDSIKLELLRALRLTHPSGVLDDNIPIPHDTNEVILAKPKNIHDVSQGWTRVGEADARGEKKKDAVSTEACPKAAGLKEGAVLAYKFKSALKTGEDDEGLDLEDESWDVVIPSFEDTTGTVNDGDVGGNLHYTG